MRVFVVALLAGYALLVTAMVFLGFCHDLRRSCRSAGSMRPDEDVSQWLADHRSPTQEDLSWIGSTLAGGHVIPVVIGLCLVVFLVTRRWLLAAFVLFVVAVESGDVPRDVADRRAPASRRRAAREPSGRRELSLRAHGRVGRAVRRPPPAHRVAVRQRRRPGRRGRRSASRFRSSSVGRGCTAACTTSPTSVAGLLMGLGALAILVFAARRRGRPPTGATASRSERRSNDVVAVIAHAGKSMGGGLEELRQVLARAGVDDPSVVRGSEESKYAPERVEKALAEGAETIFVWGGDGMVQRCVDAMAGIGRAPRDPPGRNGEPLRVEPRHSRTTSRDAVHVGLNGRERKLDLGKMNGEHFAVMAGAGLDARMIRDADGGPKDRYGRLAYIWAASKNLRVEPFKARIEVNGDLWYKGDASCLLVGNVGALFGGHGGVRQRVARGRSARARRDTRREPRAVGANRRAHGDRLASVSPRSSRRRRPSAIDVEFDRKVLYELDGGERKEVKRLKVKVKPEALTVHVPEERRMSTASHVKETWELTGDDARETLRRHRPGRAAQGRGRPAPRRRRDEHTRAGSPSRSRSCSSRVSSWSSGLAVATGSAGFRQLLLDTIQASAPGPDERSPDQRRRAGDARRPSASLPPADASA